MNEPVLEVRLGGLNLRVPQCGTRQESQAIVDAINARLKELESASTKVNTQAFALQAAYEYACAAARLRKDVEGAEATLAGTLNELASRIDEFRDRIELSSEAGT